MIRSSHIIGVTCDDCQKVWTYGGADLETCLDKAKASGWTDPDFFPISVFLGKPEHAASLWSIGVPASPSSLRSEWTGAPRCGAGRRFVGFGRLRTAVGVLSRTRQSFAARAKRRASRDVILR